MAITIYPQTSETMTPKEFLTWVSANVDAESDESILTAADALAKLNNNRTFLTDFINEYLRKQIEGENYGGFYSLQSALLGQCDNGIFKLRANFWNPPRSNGRAKEDEAALLSYELPHDHNFPFLTSGYYGPGYETVIYEYDFDKVEGYAGESVDVRFLERTKLAQNKVMFFRPSKDVHIQLPPESFSISLNLLVHRKLNPVTPQYVFDVSAGKLIDHVDSVDTIRVKCFEIAARVYDDITIDLLFETARAHRCVRTRAAALNCLVRIAPTRLREVDSLAEALPLHLHHAYAECRAND